MCPPPRTKANSPTQFAESPDFDDAVMGAVADNQDAHNTMSDYFFTNAAGRMQLIADIAKWFHTVVVEQEKTREAEESTQER